MRRLLVIVPLLVVLSLVAFTPSPTRAARQTLPLGFFRVELGEGLNQPTAMVFKGSRMFVAEKGGAIRVAFILPSCAAYRRLNR